METKKGYIFDPRHGFIPLNPKKKSKKKKETKKKKKTKK